MPVPAHGGYLYDQYQKGNISLMPDRPDPFPAFRIGRDPVAPDPLGMTRRFTPVRQTLSSPEPLP